METIRRSCAGRALLVMCLALPLSACVRALDVMVGGAPGRPLISWAWEWAPESVLSGDPCVDGLSVQDIGDPSEPYLWRLSADPCVTSVSAVYGEPPPGFRTAVEVRDIKEGRRYRVSVVGPGAIGQVIFAVQGDRLVVEK